MTSSGPRVRVRTAVRLADYEPGARFGPRLLRTFELVWLLSGSALLRVGDPQRCGEATEHRLTPGHLVLTQQGETDLYRWDARHPSQHAYVHFDLLDVGHLGDPVRWPRLRSLAGPPLLGALCDHLVGLVGRPGRADLARHERLVGVLLEAFVDGSDGGHHEQLPDPLAAAVHHVRTLWARDGLRLVEVGEVAAAAGVSRGHLHRLFRAHYGCGPVAALELVRLGRAAVTLQRSNATLAEVARQHGFADQFHFGRRFRRVHHVPPGRFRAEGGLLDPGGPVQDAGLQGLDRALRG